MIPPDASGPSWTPDPGSGIDIAQVAANGLTFEVAQAGEGDHLALCLHGFPELHYSWRHQIPLLAAKGYRVWAPNQRGYGASSRPPEVADYSADRIVADAAALFDASGAKKLTLVAHDWGGAIAWMFAINRIRPVERLVVMNLPHPRCFQRALGHWPQRRRSWYMAFFQLPWLPERMLLSGDAAAIRRAFRGMAVDKSRFPDAVLDVYARAAQRPGAITAMVNWYRAAVRHRDRMALSNGGRVEVPTLIVWGEEDTALGVETLEGTEQYVADLTIRRLPGVSHWVQQEAPEAVNAILEEWLPPA
ncbi:MULTISPECIES: alpha/beta fold hydrolase [Sphingomonas]|uniref:Alpha/beta hydrolase n=1 Tax=Sphingomonas adhaesiva TaxID=28212 RepID=A0A2A4I863_9SPHN|nr:MULTISPECIES: alpha/beta hydrolase [Sphingomonas]PCG14689.1 alpha/beta hydrolase [Sphingomonas adhaesiva]PZU81686.1 MAG: alpha/beta hydrolase [Sphingomonas sp.]